MKQPSRGAQVLALTSVGVALVSLDVSIVNVAFGSLIAEWGTGSRRLLTWIFSGYNIAYAAGLLTAGRLADAFGRKRAFLTGLVIFSIGSTLCGLAGSPAMLVAARVVQALGGAILTPASIALVLPEFPVEKRSVAIGIWGAVGGLSAAMGPVVGGFLVQWFSWRSIFFVNIPFCALAFLVGTRLLRESRDESARITVDIVGALLAVSGVGSLTLAIVQSDEWGWASTTTVGIFVASAVLIFLFTLRCNKVAVPLLDLKLLKLPFVSAANLAGIVFSLGFYSMIFLNTQWLQTVWNYSTLRSGLAIFPGPFMAAVVAAPAGRLAQKYGHSKIIGIGATIFAVAMFSENFLLDASPHYWTRYFPCAVFTGIGVGLCISTLSSSASAYLPPARFAMGSALNTTSRQVGAALGLATVGSLLSSSIASGNPMQGIQRGWVFVGITAVATGLVMIVMYRRPTAEQLAAAA
jgi:EmrB/QacA subfamily drug resistance transporter